MVKRIQKLYIIRFCCSFLLLITICKFADTATINDGWNLLIGNKPDEARKVFIELTTSGNNKIAAQAYRGLGAVAEFYDDLNGTVENNVKAYKIDKDVIKLSARPEMFENKLPNNKKAQNEILNILKENSSNKSLFNGWYNDALMQLYAEKGDIANAQKISKTLGIIRTWKCIGPFENISNCGFSTAYPPEKDSEFEKKYVGKNGDKVFWFDINNQSPRGWLFLDNYSTEVNAVYYFYCNVISDNDQDVYLSFGASGAYRIYLNNNIVLQDSIFRNTGIDAFIQKVKLNKGDNKLLIKIGYEDLNVLSTAGKANFILRFLDSTFSNVNGICYSTTKANFKQDSTAYSNLASSPVLDSVAATLNRDIKADKYDFDAIFSLINLYNIYEKTNEAQKLIQSYLTIYPQSSLLYSLLAESYLRAKKKTDYAIAMHKAFELCKTNANAWAKQLATLMANYNERGIEDFLQNTDEKFQLFPVTIMAKLTLAIKQKKQSDIFSLISMLEQNGKDSYDAVSFLSTIYQSQGSPKKVEKIIKDYIAQNRTSVRPYNDLAGLYLNQGNTKKTIGTYDEAAKYNPDDPNIYYYLANLFYTTKKFDRALNMIDKCIKILPNNSSILNLKGNILTSLNDTVHALETFQNTIDYTSDDFLAWEKIRTLKGKKGFEQMVSLPNVDSIIAVSKEWVKKADKAALISYIHDNYFYPSKASRSRMFMVVYLPNQNEIDEWKEYTIGYNSNYQTLDIDKAYSKKSNGTEVEADQDRNSIVFKSLEPGDYIVLEYSLRDYYDGQMAGKIYGCDEINRSISTYDYQVRFITPDKDTIPYRLVGDSLLIDKKRDEDYTVTTIRNHPYIANKDEAYGPTDYKTFGKIVYSNFHDWGDIVNWYDELSGFKQNKTIELRNLADSLFKGLSSPYEKAEQIHKFITNTINYSFVPFRQSAWIPQAAQDVFANKIGDCKDMASLGKCLMDLAGIESNLVLVNTQIHNFSDHAFMGPNFDHCILSYKINGKDYFADFTDKYTSLGNLPLGDQGAMALVIKKGNSALINLPMDTPDKRFIKRDIKITIDPSGNMKQQVQTTRNGIYSSAIRTMYRYLSDSERKTALQKTLSDDYGNVNVDSLSMGDLNSLKDTMQYSYSFSVNDAADINGSNAVFGVNIPDAINPKFYPSEKDRLLPIDLSLTYTGITKMDSQMDIYIPNNWKIIGTMKNVELKTSNAEYELSFKMEGKKISIHRHAVFNYNKIFTADEFKPETELLNKITKEDNVKLIFNVK